MRTVEIETEFIKLDQLLKFADVVDSGGFAKLLIAEGYVSLNGTTCTERGKKIRSGDTVGVDIPDEDGDVESHVDLKVCKKV